MSWENIVGHKFQKEYLQKTVASGKISHAYLFVGKEGIGKKLCALEFAKLLNCFSPGENGSCDQCKSCVSIDKGVHPDLLKLTPEGETLKIDQIREFNKWIHYKPLEARYRAGIIENITSMTEEAANCILKTLEEPPPKSIILLTSSDMRNLPRTLLSRCNVLYFAPLPARTIESFLVKNRSIASQKAFSVAQKAQGSIGKALQILEKEEEPYRLIENFFDGLSSISSLLSMGSKLLASKTNLQETLSLLELYLRDLLMYSRFREKELLYFTELEEKILKTIEGKEFDEKTVYNLIENIEQLNRDINSNVNQDVALIHFLLELKEVIQDAI
ncbi:MAG: polymerase subunit gamma/tau [Candidatus Atribacteria bacterium]|uniref:DNA polymerase III subunit delta' n=1 Tax=Atrimonas thermophila TaxID=3064161 RepID=UPI0024ABC1B3|nr:polymerase subunit gamma/tau [Candidatus Atribacteria bacterium]